MSDFDDDDLFDSEGEIAEPSDADRHMSMAWLVVVVLVGLVALWLSLNIGGGPWR